MRARTQRAYEFYSGLHRLSKRLAKPAWLDSNTPMHYKSVRLAEVAWLHAFFACFIE